MEYKNIYLESIDKMLKNNSKIKVNSEQIIPVWAMEGNMSYSPLMTCGLKSCIGLYIICGNILYLAHIVIADDYEFDEKGNLKKVLEVCRKINEINSENAKITYGIIRGVEQLSNDDLNVQKSNQSITNIEFLLKAKSERKIDLEASTFILTSNELVIESKNGEILVKQINELPVYSNQELVSVMNLT